MAPKKAVDKNKLAAKQKVGFRTEPLRGGPLKREPSAARCVPAVMPAGGR